MMVHQKLRALRKDAGLSQPKVARRLGKTVVTIQNYEKGKQVPNVAACKKLAEIYGVLEGEIFSCEGWW